MADPRNLCNPLSLGAVAGLAIVRGATYLAQDWGLVDWSSAPIGPSLPLVPMDAVGLAWLAGGLFLHAGMFYWRWFRPAVAILTALYLTWSILYITDLFISPDLPSLVGLAGYMAMVPVTITLGVIELENNADTERGEDGGL